MYIFDLFKSKRFAGVDTYVNIWARHSGNQGNDFRLDSLHVKQTNSNNYVLLPLLIIKKKDERVFSQKSLIVISSSFGS